MNKEKAETWSLLSSGLHEIMLLLEKKAYSWKKNTTQQQK